MGAPGPRWRPNRVLVGYDSGEGGADAVALARDLGNAGSATSILEPRQVAGLVYGGGSVAHVLTDVATEVGADLIAIGAGHRGDEVDLLVVGSRGYGAFSRVMIGSVAAGLIHEAHCPVLVAPRPRREEMNSDWRLRKPRREAFARGSESHR
jgi:nucleotide-binding universal stress UspA family protein